MYRSMSTALRESLPAHPWRLVANIATVREDPGLAIVVKLILEINEATEHLLINKAGLIDGPPPDSFKTFMHHSRLLRAAWEHGGELVPPEAGTRVQDVPYPDEFSDDIKASYSRVRAALDALQQADP